ncbi:cytochrome c oxidase subunit 2A [Allomeiothermus silvanus]
MPALSLLHRVQGQYAQGVDGKGLQILRDHACHDTAAPAVIGEGSALNSTARGILLRLRRTATYRRAAPRGTLVPPLLSTLSRGEGNAMEEKRPTGALGVVVILTIFILTFWFVTFWVFLSRG